MVWLMLPAGIFAADYVIKKKAESWKEEELPKKILNGKILMKKYHNRGAALNFMENRPQILTGCTAGMTAGLAGFYLWLMTGKEQILLKIGTGMLLGGAAGNVWDRLRRHYVVDYFSFRTKWKKLNKIVFNLSDMFIFLGAAIILWQNAFRKS